MADTEKRNVPYELREQLLEKYHFFTLDDTRELYMYNELAGIYISGAETKAEGILNTALGKSANPGLIHSAISLLKMATYINRNLLDKNPNLIVVRNGVLDIRTQELLPCSHEHYFTKMLPVTYNPDSKCPEFKSFLSEVTSLEYHRVIQQMLGFLLKRLYSPKKAFIFIGPKDAGKTTFANVVNSFLGENNITPKTMQHICERFGKIDLFGKMANICDENPSVAFKGYDTFKALTGDSLIEGETKGVQRKISFWNTAKMIYLCNAIPPAHKADDAFYGRWIIIPFPKTFDDSNPNRDPNKKYKLTTDEELSGILNFALEGYKDLERETKFDYTDKPREIKKLYLGYSGNTVSRFISERLDLGAKSEEYMLETRIFEEYKNYCIEEGEIYKNNEDSFGREFRKFVNDIENREYRPTINGKQTYALRGVALLRN